MRRSSSMLAAAAAIASLALTIGVSPASAGSSLTANPPSPGLQTSEFTTAESRFYGHAFNQGWWANNDATSNSNDNYIVGRCCGRINHRNFFTFDLSSLDRRVVFAQLRVHSAVVRGDAIERIGLFDVSIPAATVNFNTTIDLDIFADLGTGSSYGVFDIARDQDREILQLTLNRSAINDINDASGGFFSIGGRLLSLGDRREEFLFGRSGKFPAELVVRTVPGDRSND